MRRDRSGALRPPPRVLTRTDCPIFEPEVDDERAGQYVAVTTYAESLACHNNRWFMYDGCADSHVGVAVAEAGPGMS